MSRHPKLLPLLAHRSAVPIELAENLWRRAEAEAAGVAGGRDGADYHRFAIERLLDLIDDESPAPPARDSAWFWRCQRRIAARSFSAAKLGACWWNTTLHPAWQQRLAA